MSRIENIHRYRFWDLKDLNKGLITLPDSIKDVKVGDVICDTYNFEELMEKISPQLLNFIIQQTFDVKIKKIHRVVATVIEVDEEWKMLKVKQVIDYEESIVSDAAEKYILNEDEITSFDDKSSVFYPENK